MNRRTFLHIAALSVVGAVIDPRSIFAPSPVNPTHIIRGDNQWSEMRLEEIAPSTFAEAFAQECGEALVQGIEEGLKASRPVTLKAEFSTDGVKWIDISGYDASFVINVRNYRVP